MATHISIYWHSDKVTVSFVNYTNILSVRRSLSNYKNTYGIKMK